MRKLIETILERTVIIGGLLGVFLIFLAKVFWLPLTLVSIKLLFF